MQHEDAIRILAVTTADAIRERLITYTPVTNPHQALVLSYTIRQYQALEESNGLRPEEYVDITDAIAEALLEATTETSDGPAFRVPRLP